VIIACGAIERPVPYPGWTLPGVMNAGAGQILFKAQGVVPADGVVLAGAGPLLLLLAWQYLQAGVTVQAVLDTAPPLNYIRAVRHLPRAVLAAHYVTKGLRYQRDLGRAGVLIRHGVSDVRAIGNGSLEAVSFRHAGRRRLMDSALLLTHFGVIPSTFVTRVAGCRHHWDEAQQCWRPRLDVWGNTSVEGIMVAGDSAGIGGARSAEHAGRLAAFHALHALGILDEVDRDRMALEDRQWMLEDLRIRPFLEALYRIPRELLQVSDDDTIVCRCEEVTAGDIRAAVSDGHLDANQVKFLTRCGMGPCQGRQCADSVAHLVACAAGTDVPDSGHYRVRPPIKPLSLGQLAALYPDETE
jgi:NADPH-dependent 2,4-dienoyl-CoA reductase/sulfur reductase-like enzyme